MQIPEKLVYEQFDVHENIWRTRNCRRKFIKNLLPEKRIEKARKSNKRDLMAIELKEILKIQ